MSLDFQGWLLTLAPGIPLLLGVLWGVPQLRPLIGRLAPWSALPALVLALLGDSNSSPVMLDWLLLGSVIGLTPTTQVFLFFTALIWTAAGLHGRGALGEGDHCERFCVFWLFTLAGNIGLIVALDAPLFYASFALMTFAAYGLIVHDRGEESRRAGRVYLVLAVLGEALILLGLMLATLASDASLRPLLADLPAAIGASVHRDWIVAGLWLGFGIKVGLPLLHFSLPLAYAAAPIPVAAVLAGAMIKAGLLGWLVTLPLGVDGLQVWGSALILSGLFAAFAAAFVGVHQRQPREVLAYSSISQMGMITVILGVWFHAPQVGPAALLAVTLFAFHHALAKAALFLGADVLGARGSGIRVPVWRWVVLAIPALALVGWMPSGMLTKASMKAVLAGDTVWIAFWPQLVPLLTLGAVGTALLMARFFWLLYRDTTDRSRGAGRVSAGWLVLSIAVLAAAFLLPRWGVYGVWPSDFVDLWTLAWPVVFALLLAVAAARFLRPWPIPPGDLLLLLTPVPALALRAVRAIGVTGPAVRHILRHRLAQMLALYLYVDHRLGRFAEYQWRRQAMLLFALLLALFLLLSLLGAIGFREP
jgi:hydrogenase-4 component B